MQQTIPMGYLPPALPDAAILVAEADTRLLASVVLRPHHVFRPLFPSRFVWLIDHVAEFRFVNRCRALRSAAPPIISRRGADSTFGVLLFVLPIFDPCRFGVRIVLL